MSTYLAGLCGVGVALAVLCGISAFMPAPEQPEGMRPARRPGPITRFRRYAATPAGRLRVVVAAVAAGLGLVLAAFTGLFAGIILLPVVSIAVLTIFGPQPGGTEMLEALDRWVRSIAQSLPIGRDVPGAIRSSVLSAPEALAPHLAQLISRLNVGMRTDEALLRMADELADPDADAVLAALVLASRRTGAGLTATLHGLADSIQAQLTMLRAVKLERDRPRQTVRIVTILGVLMIGGSILFGNFFTAYATPVGQIILTVLIAAYFGVVLIMGAMTRPRPRARVLARITDGDPSAAHTDTAAAAADTAGLVETRMPDLIPPATVRAGQKAARR